MPSDIEDAGELDSNTIPEGAIKAYQAYGDGETKKISIPKKNRM
jgi:hypothetical protein